MECMKKKAWSPYKAGIIIGLLQIPAFILIETAIGTSSSYVTLAGHVASWFDAGADQVKYFTKYMTSHKYVWQNALVIGIALGAYLSARASGTLRKCFSPIWTKAMGTTHLAQRLSIGFVAGFLMVIGARLAGGCTSGHGLSGVAQLATGSLVTVAFMFAGGILVANIMRRL